MNVFYKSLLVLIMTAASVNGYAQDNLPIAELIKQGIQLNGEKNYAAAIEQFKAALAAEPDNVQANYQMAFTLFSSGKNADALPFINKATRGSDLKFTAAAYSLMGSIYTAAGQLNAAVAAYKNGIKADAGNQRIYYNLGIACFKGKQYEDAAENFINAVERDSSDAGSIRMYALSAFHQDKRAEALLGFCRFLMLEPNSRRSVEAFGNLTNILQSGVLKSEPGYKPSSATKKIADYQNQLIRKAIAPLSASKKSSPVGLLTSQLAAIFSSLKSTPKDKSYWWYALADYFGKLPEANLPAFARYISQSAIPENAKWLSDNPDKRKALGDWFSANPLK